MTSSLRLVVASLLIACTLAACAPAAPTFLPTTAPTSVPPSKIGYHSAVYDIKADRIIIVGGEADIDHELGDTWTYDITTNAWTKMSPAQKPTTGEGPMAYDSASDRTIHFIGEGDDGIPADASSYFAANQTWAYDYNTDTWTNLHAHGGPSGVLGERMVYDTKADRMILFGGLTVPLPQDLTNFTYKNETWVYDFHTNTWTNMQPKTSPPGQCFFQMAYDAAADRVLAWITPDSGGSNTMWAYDYKANTWTAQPVKEPTFRPYAGMVYVPTVQRDFVFGGVTEPDERPLGDMWTYDSVSNTWEQIKFTSGPSARGWHTMTYITKLDRIVLIGGGADRLSFTNEVWIFDPNAKTWTQAGSK